MALSVKHTFQSAKADSGDASLVRPSNWNAEHTITTDGNTLLGKPTAGSGAVVPITIGTGLSFSSGVLISNVVDSQAQLDAKFNGRVARTGDNMTGDLSMNNGISAVSSPVLRQTATNYRTWYIHAYANGAANYWRLVDESAQAERFRVLLDGSIWCSQLGDINTRIEQRCNDFRNTCVTSSRMAGFGSAAVKTGSSGGGDINNSAYVLTRAYKSGIEELTFECRQPQLYIANSGWYAAFPW